MTTEKPHGPIVAAVLGSLSPGETGRAFTREDQERLKVPQDWQMLGAQYEWADIHGVMKGLPHGYLADVLGRAPAAGEQLGLARAAPRDAEVWRDTVVETSSASHRRIQAS